MPAPPARAGFKNPQINFGGHCIKKFGRISNRTPTDFARAERVVSRTRSVRSTRLPTRLGAPQRGAAIQKISSHFFCGSSPHPSAARRKKEKERKFFDCAAATNQGRKLLK